MDRSKLSKMRKALESLVDELETDARDAKSVLHQLEDVISNVYKDVPGVEGAFDGVQVVTDTGEKLPVPENYAAKSKLLVGDRLKMIEEEGKQLFKQVHKVGRRKLTGVASRKEGDWVVLTELGSYKVLQRAAEFNELKPNEEVEVLIPEDNAKVEYAALQRVLHKDANGNIIREQSHDERPEKPTVKPTVKHGFAGAHGGGHGPGSFGGGAGSRVGTGGQPHSGGFAKSTSGSFAATTSTATPRPVVRPIVAGSTAAVSPTGSPVKPEHKDIPVVKKSPAESVTAKPAVSVARPVIKAPAASSAGRGVGGSRGASGAGVRRTAARKPQEEASAPAPTTPAASATNITSIREVSDDDLR